MRPLIASLIIASVEPDFDPSLHAVYLGRYGSFAYDAAFSHPNVRPCWVAHHCGGSALATFSLFGSVDAPTAGFA